MAKKSTKKDQKQVAGQIPLSAPWISMKAGFITITILSIAMAVLTAWEAVPSKGLTQGILLGILFGGMIWIVFLGFILFRRIVH